jgi:hypothetical protein
MPHIGDELGDRGHGIRPFARPVDDLHDFLIISCEPVVADMAFIASPLTEWPHTLHERRASRRRFAKDEHVGRERSRRSQAGSISISGRITRCISDFHQIVAFQQTLKVPYWVKISLDDW